VQGRRISLWSSNRHGWSPQLTLGCRRLYSEFLIPFQNAPKLLHRNIIKFDELRVRNILLFWSAPRCHSVIILWSAPLRLQVLIHLLIECHILMPEDLLIFWISKLIAILACSYPIKMHLLDFGSNLLCDLALHRHMRCNQKYAGGSGLPLCQSMLPPESHSSGALMALCCQIYRCWLHLPRTTWAIQSVSACFMARYTIVLFMPSATPFWWGFLEPSSLYRFPDSCITLLICHRSIHPIIGLQVLKLPTWFIFN